MRVIDVTIKKPLYGNKVYIRDKYIRDAIRENAMLRISIPQGTAIHDPREWKSTGDKMEKVFNIPDKPMILWGNHVNVEVVEEKKPKKKKEIKTETKYSLRGNAVVSYKVFIFECRKCVKTRQSRDILVADEGICKKCRKEMQVNSNQPTLF